MDLCKRDGSYQGGKSAPFVNVEPLLFLGVSSLNIIIIICSPHSHISRSAAKISEFPVRWRQDNSNGRRDDCLGAPGKCGSIAGSAVLPARQIDALARVDEVWISNQAPVGAGDTAVLVRIMVEPQRDARQGVATLDDIPSRNVDGPAGVGA